MPRFWNARTTVCATCWSTPVSICGSASRIVTSRARVDEERRELAADRAAADHRDARREPRAAAAPLRTTARAAPSNASPSTARARGDEPVAIEHVAPADHAAVGDADRPAVGLERAGSGDDGDLAALQQRLEPRRQPVDDGLLAGLRGRELRGRVPTSARRTRRADARSAAPPRSGAAPWPGCTHGAGRCRRPAAPRRSRCSCPALAPYSAAA